MFTRPPECAYSRKKGIPGHPFPPPFRDDIADNPKRGKKRLPSLQKSVMIEREGAQFIIRDYNISKDIKQAFKKAEYIGSELHLSALFFYRKGFSSF